MLWQASLTLRSPSTLRASCESRQSPVKASWLRFARFVTARQSPDDRVAQRRAAPRHRRPWNRWFSSYRRPSCPLPDSRHSRDVLRRRPGHEVCGIGDSAIKTARIVLRTRTFEGHVPPAARNKLTCTMRYAAPTPACRPRCPSPETSPEIITDLPTLQALARRSGLRSRPHLPLPQMPATMLTFAHARTQGY